MQAKFDEVVTCNSPDIYDSWMLLNNTEEQTLKNAETYVSAN